MNSQKIKSSQIEHYVFNSSFSNEFIDFVLIIWKLKNIEKIKKMWKSNKKANYFVSFDKKIFSTKGHNTFKKIRSYFFIIFEVCMFFE